MSEGGSRLHEVPSGSLEGTGSTNRLSQATDRHVGKDKGLFGTLEVWA